MTTPNDRERALALRIIESQSEPRGGNRARLVNAIAQALADERERAAKIAETCVIEGGVVIGPDERHAIAAAIRHADTAREG